MVNLTSTRYRVTVYNGIEIIACKLLNKGQVKDFINSVIDSYLSITVIDIELV